MLGYLYVFLGIFIICREIICFYNKKVDYFTIFDIYFFSYYVLPGAVHNLMPLYVSRYGFIFKYGEGSYLACLLIYLGYTFVYLGYSKIFKFKFGDYINISHKNSVYVINKEKTFFGEMVILLWIIGLTALFIHASFYGGIKEAILNSASIRNGDITTNQSTSILFLSKFMVCLLVASYIVFIKFLNQEVSSIVLYSSLGLSFIYIVVNAGRGALLLFILNLLFIYNSYKRIKFKLSSWALMFLVIVLGISYLRPLFMSIPYIIYGMNAFWDMFIYIISNQTVIEFSPSDLIYRFCFYLEHKYVSLEIAIRAIETGKYAFNYFLKDIFASLIALIPEAILPFEKPSTVTNINTFLIYGRYSMGDVPPGGIAFGYYGFGIIGVILFSLSIGIIGRRLFHFFDCFNSVYMRALQFVYGFVWIDFYINGDLRQCVVRHFVLLIILIIIKIKSKKIIVGDN